jgi:hypothetical protein
VFLSYALGLETMEFFSLSVSGSPSRKNENIPQAGSDFLTHFREVYDCISCILLIREKELIIGASVGSFLLEVHPEHIKSLREFSSIRCGT